MRYYLIALTLMLASPLHAQCLLTATTWKQDKSRHELNFSTDSLTIYAGAIVVGRYPFYQADDTLQIYGVGQAQTDAVQLPRRSLLRMEGNGSVLRVIPLNTPGELTEAITLHAVQPAGIPAYDWPYLDLQQDSIPGCSFYKACALLTKSVAVPVVVGVIDTGIDHTHAQLKRFIWTNPGELPGNKRDDDKNGYVDDVHGWYWLAMSDKKFLVNDVAEAVRILQGDSLDSTNPSLVKQARVIYRAESSRLAQLKLALSDTARLARTLASFAPYMGSSVLTLQTLRQLPEGPDSLCRAVRRLALETYRPRLSTWEQFSARLVANAPRYYAVYSESWNYTYNLDYKPFGLLRRTFAGQGDGPGSSEPEILAHGTFVSGVLTARLSTAIDSIEGRHLQLIDLAAGPASGDERDEFMAQAIRYAVDKGAAVINISMAKRLSAKRTLVDSALALAHERDVLVIKCAGNDSNDNDSVPYFPVAPVNTIVDAAQSGNFLEVGNSSFEWNEKLVYYSSNYGASSVDLFAPGLQIRTTAPGQGYITVSGTSFSAPLVARVAALIRSHFPNLSAPEVKQILLESVRKPSFRVLKPGTTELVPMNQLCRSGGIMDAEAAVRMAFERTKLKK